MSEIRSRQGTFWLAIGLLAICFGTGWAFRSPGESVLANQAISTKPVNLDPSANTQQNVIHSQRSPKLFPVTVRKPSGPPRLDTGLRAPSGAPVTAACSTCHATRPPNQDNRSPTDLDEFHQALSFAHGKVSCLSCHNPNDYDALHLADGKLVEYSEVMTLCAQCHGPQTRDYEHGAHGGMTGYWDLSRGPRVRNNCVDCHDPHSPGLPAMQPTFKPRDRFLEDNHESGAGEHD